VIRRAAFLLFATLLTSLPIAAQEKRAIIPMENFLPSTTQLYVSVPDGGTATKILARLGDSAEGLAGRLARRTGVDAAVATERLAALTAAADGPATFSRHRIRVPGRPVDGRSFLVTLSSTSGQDARLKDAMSAFLTDVVMAGPESKVTGERLMDLTVLHFRNATTELYLASTRGFVLVASSPFLMGLVLREMQSPSVKSLRYRGAFKEAQQLRDETGSAAGLFWCAKEALPKFLGPLGIKRLAGVLEPAEGGLRDEIRVVPEPHSLLPRIAADGEVPAAWIDAGPDGVWVGASMTPRGVLSMAIAILEPDHVMQAIRIDEVAAGAVEFLWRPGRAPAMAVRVRKDADEKKITRPLGDLAAKRSDGAIVISEEIGAWPAQLSVTDAGRQDRTGGARLSARVPTLLGLLGRSDAPGTAKTVFAIRREGKVVTVSAGHGGVGPIALVLGALLP